MFRIVLSRIAASPVRTATYAAARVFTSWVELLSARFALPESPLAAERTRSHAVPLVGRAVSSAGEIQIPVDAFTFTRASPLDTVSSSSPAVLAHAGRTNRGRSAASHMGKRIVMSDLLDAGRRQR